MKHENLRKFKDTLAATADAAAEGARGALSSLLGHEIRVQDTSVAFRPLTDLPEMMGGEETEVVTVLIELAGDVDGSIMLVLYFESARQVMRELTEPYGSYSGELDEIGVSALKETGNIMMTSFLNAISKVSDMSLEPGPPLISAGPCGAVMQHIMITHDTSELECLFIDTAYEDTNQCIRAHILFLPFPEYVDKLQPKAVAES